MIVVGALIATAVALFAYILWVAARHPPDNPPRRYYDDELP